MTKFRREIEEHLEARMDDFALRDNARIIRSDIASLASALSIGAAANGPLPATGVVTTEVATPPATDLSSAVAVRTVTPIQPSSTVSASTKM